MTDVLAKPSAEKHRYHFLGVSSLELQEKVRLSGLRNFERESFKCLKDNADYENMDYPDSSRATV